MQNFKPIDLESEIQQLYESYSYLIEEKFLNRQIFSQYQVSSGFIDIIIFLEDEIVVVELKKDRLEEKHILQIASYLRDIKNVFKDTSIIRGILIGKKPKSGIEKIIQQQVFQIKILVLNRDIPTRIEICDNCRMANNPSKKRCWYCQKER